MRYDTVLRFILPLLMMLALWEWHAIPAALPTADGIAAKAASLPTRERYCDDLRAELGEPPWEQEIRSRAAAQRPVSSAPSGTSSDTTDLKRTESDLNLNGLTFSNADLRFATLRKSSVDGTNFSGADLRCADFTLAHGKADFRATDLRGALMIGADLQTSSFRYAKLDLAQLTSAILQETNLEDSSLSSASLVGTDLEKAKIGGADLAFADYRPASSPRPSALKNVDKVFPRTADFIGLSMLRKTLTDAGSGTDARLVTYVIETWRDHYRLAGASAGGSLQTGYESVRFWLRRLLFDAPVAYGARPAGALIALAAFIPLFWTVYLILLATPLNTGAVGLFRILPKARVSDAAGTLGEAEKSDVVRVSGSGGEAVAASLWFSIVCATRFGYGTFTIGSWLSALQYRESEYRAVGWIRVVGGLQSLISFYLLILLVITLLGDPFSLWP